MMLKCVRTALFWCLAWNAQSLSINKMMIELDRSLERYPSVDAGSSAGYLEDLLTGEKITEHTTIIVLDGRIFFDRRFLGGDKNNKHIEMLFSLTKFGYALPNVAYRFFDGASGDLKRDAYEHPVMVICKVNGYNDPGVLVPNPYFVDLKDWDEMRARLLAQAHARPYKKRDNRVIWRGEISSHEAQFEKQFDTKRPEFDPCETDKGNFARLQAASLSYRSPELVDVKCTGSDFCEPRNETKYPCIKYKYDRDMWDTSQNIEKIVSPEGRINEVDYSRWQKALSSVVLLWQAEYVEWYYPLLQHGKTHLEVNKSTLVPSLNMIDAMRPTDQLKLRKGAKEIDEYVISGKGLANYLAIVLDRISVKFSMGVILDDPCATEVLFSRLNCSGLDLVLYDPDNFESIFAKQHTLATFRLNNKRKEKKHRRAKTVSKTQDQGIRRTGTSAPVRQSGCQAIIDHAKIKCTSG